MFELFKRNRIKDKYSKMNELVNLNVDWIHATIVIGGMKMTSVRGPMRAKILVYS